MTDRKKNPKSYRSGKTQVSLWDLSLQWVDLNKSKVAALKGLRNLPCNMKQKILHAVPFHPNGYPKTIRVKELTQFGQTRFIGHYKNYHDIIITSPSAYMELRFVTHHID